MPEIQPQRGRAEQECGGPHCGQNSADSVGDGRPGAEPVIGVPAFFGDPLSGDGFMVVETGRVAGENVFMVHSSHLAIPGDMGEVLPDIVYHRWLKIVNESIEYNF